MLQGGREVREGTCQIGVKKGEGREEGSGDGHEMQLQRVYSMFSLLEHVKYEMRHIR